MVVLSSVNKYKWYFIGQAIMGWRIVAEPHCLNVYSNVRTEGEIYCSRRAMNGRNLNQLEKRKLCSRLHYYL